MVAGTAAGEMTFLSRLKRNTTVIAERDSVLWKMEVSAHVAMGTQEGWAFCRQFEEVLLRISAEEQEVLMVSHCHLVHPRVLAHVLMLFSTSQCHLISSTA